MPSLLPVIPAIRYGFIAVALCMGAYLILGSLLDPYVTDAATRATIGRYGLLGLIGGSFLLLALGGACFLHLFFYHLLRDVPGLRQAAFRHRGTLLTLSIGGWWALWAAIAVYTLRSGSFTPLLHGLGT